MNQRGEYGDPTARRTAYSTSAAIGVIAPRSAKEGPNRVPVNIAIIGIGAIIGFASWPGVKKRTPLSLIAMGTSGSMVAVGLTELLFGGL